MFMEMMHDVHSARRWVTRVKVNPRKKGENNFSGKQVNANKAKPAAALITIFKHSDDSW